VVIEQEDLAPTLQRVQQRVAEAREYLNFERLRDQIEQMEVQSAREGFWGDVAAAQDHMRRLNRLKSSLTPWEALETEVRDALELAEMAQGDPAMTQELIENAEKLDRTLGSLETRVLLKDPDDEKPAYLHIHAGAGGTESCDWVQMLLRMYARWCERKGYEVEQVEMTEGEEAGLRSVTLLIKGEYPFGMLKSECGVHRLVRISPFDANKRRHTSFCSVDVWPQVDDSIEVDIKDEDLKIDTFRASGAGGQHVNKTSSAVRITHLPTKIVVSCQNERSQHQNKARAIKMLQGRLYQFHRDLQLAEEAVREDSKMEITWGSQIRSYVFQPYQMVKDVRTRHETGNIPAVMDGDIDGFLEAYLRWSAGASAPK